MKLLILFLLTINVYAVTTATQTTSIGSVEIKQELEKQDNLNKLNYELKVLELKKNIATTKQNCIKNGGCMPSLETNTNDIAKNNNQLDQKIEFEMHNKQTAINSMNNLDIVVISNDQVMFNHSARHFKVGDDVGNGVIIQQINNTYIRVAYQDITSDIYINYGSKN
jgi:hypothetical protein